VLRKAGLFPRNFSDQPSLLTAALIVFPKYTDLICIFNQCSNRVHFQPACLSRSFDLPRDSFPRDKFAAQGPFRWNSIFAISNYRRNREAERISSSSFLLSIDLSFLYSLLAPRSAIVQPLPLNSISFVSFHVFCYVRSTCVNKMIVKLIRNWRTICEKSTHCKNRNIIFQSDEI